MAVTVPEHGAGVPPHNEEAEIAVLGTILLTEQALDQIFVDLKISADDFYRPRHQLIFRSMLRLKEKAEPEAVDAITVCDDLKREGRLEEAGGPAYVHALPTMVPAAGAVRDYARIVRDHAILRRLLGAAREIQDKVATDGTDPRSLVEQAEQAIFRAGHNHDSSQLRKIEDVLHEELDKLERLSKEGQSLTGTPSGYRDLDEITGGFQPGNLIVLAARPAMGKCLPGAALVYDPSTGVPRRMDDVVARIEAGRETWVATLGRDLRLRPALATAAFRNGVRPVFRVRTRLGREIAATGNHPLLTVAGWRALETLQGGDQIAVPNRLPRTDPAAKGPAYARGVPARHRATVAAGQWDPVVAGRGERPWPAAVEPAAADRHGWHLGTRGLSRPLSAELEAAVGVECEDEADDADVWWDEIVSIEHVGAVETFDITVPLSHNFVADDVVVHNSALATCFAENASVDHGRGVALFSLEMSEGELAQRFIASRAKINGESLRKGRVRADRWPKVLQATEKLARAPLYIDDSSDLGVLELRAKARRLHQRHPIGLLIVDYLQLMRAEDPRDGRVEQVGKMSRGLKILARELHIPVIAISQLSRAVESRPDKRPLMSDLRESGNIEQDADMVMFVYRDEYYNPDTTEKPGVAELLIGKHRNGPVGSVELTFLERYPKFASLAREAPIGGAPGGGAG